MNSKKYLKNSVRDPKTMNKEKFEKVEPLIIELLKKMASDSEEAQAHYELFNEEIQSRGLGHLLQEAIKTFIDKFIAEHEVSGTILDVVESLSTGSTQDVDKIVKNTEAFSHIQENVLKVFGGEWNEFTSAVSLVSYLLEYGEVPAQEGEETASTEEQTNLGEETQQAETGVDTKEEEGTDTEEDVSLKLGDIFAIEEAEFAQKEAKLTKAQRDRLPDSAFCGPGRSFPAHDRAHVIAGLRLLGRSKFSDSTKAKIRACLLRKGRRFGVGTEADGLAFHLCMLNDGEKDYPMIFVTSREQLQEVKGVLESIKKDLLLSEAQYEALEIYIDSLDQDMKLLEAESDETFVEAFLSLEERAEETVPIEFGPRHMAELILSKEYDADVKKYLTTLVGLKKKFNISKEEIEESGSKYRVFGVTVLEHLLSAPPIKAEKETSISNEAQQDSGSNQTGEPGNTDQEIQESDTKHKGIEVTEASSESVPGEISHKKETKTQTEPSLKVKSILWDFVRFNI